MLFLTSILILEEKQTRCRTTSLWKQSALLPDDVLAHQVYINVSFSELQIHLARQTIQYSLNKKVLTKEGWPSEMHFIFDPWNRGKLRADSMPHPGSQHHLLRLICHTLQSRVTNLKNQKGLSIPGPPAGAAWHWEARLDSFHPAYQKLPKWDHVGHFRAPYTHCPCAPPLQHPRDWGGRGAAGETSAR